MLFNVLLNVIPNTAEAIHIINIVFKWFPVYQRAGALEPQVYFSYDETPNVEAHTILTNQKRCTWCYWDNEPPGRRISLLGWDAFNAFKTSKPTRKYSQTSSGIIIAGEQWRRTFFSVKVRQRERGGILYPIKWTVIMAFLLRVLCPCTCRRVMACAAVRVTLMCVVRN